MAWEEWEQLKAEALARQQQDRMQLNGTGSGESAGAVEPEDERSR
ncbi:hypothetical protein GCM10010307_39520 [Streptomyces vastus]|uniref:Uncharacterized protein n=1 Tax=Streptomyces vastus TaxID=285451 RepID=A0ABN3R143_9ACTN